LTPVSPRWTPNVLWLAYAVIFLTAISVPLRSLGKAAMQGTLGMACVFSLILIISNRDVNAQFKRALQSRLALLWGILGLAWVIGLPFSFNSLGSFEIGLRSLGYMLGTTMIYAVLRSYPEHHAWMWKVLTASAFAAGFDALLTLNHIPFIGAHLMGGVGAFSNPSGTYKPYAVTALCLAPVVILAGHHVGGQWKRLAYVHLLIVVMIIFMTGNRSAMAGLIAMLGITSLCVATHSRRTFIGVLTILAIITGIIASWLYMRLPEAALTHVKGLYLPTWLVDPHRQKIWEFTFDKFLEHPIFGIGIDQINYIPGAHKIVPGISASAYQVPSHPHNWMLELASETGLVGLCAVLLCLGYLVYVLSIRYLKHKDGQSMAGLVLIGAFFSSSLFNFSIWTSWWQLTFYILIAMVLSMGSKVRSNL